MGAQFHADGQTDLPQLILFFRNFATTPKNGCVLAKIRCYQLHPEV